MTRTIVLEGERPKSWNAFYSGKHWAVRREWAQRCHALVRTALSPNDRPFENPVHITVTAYFKNQPLDACNITAKLYIDGMLATSDWEDGARSLLWDDDMRYVTQVTTVPLMDEDNPRVEIHIQEVKHEKEE